MKRLSNHWSGSSNLDLYWTSKEQTVSEDGEKHLVARAQLWSREPLSILASIYIRDKEYAVYTQGLYGITPKQEKELNDHLQSLGFIPRPKHDGI